MRFGVALPSAYEGLGYPVGMVPDPRDLVALARAAERMGYAAVWVNDHLAVPAFPRAAPQAPHFHEALVTPGAIATATERVGIGTAVLAAPLRDAVPLARQAATLAGLLGGRFRLGLGAGAYRDELAAVRPGEMRARRLAGRAHRGAPTHPRRSVPALDRGPWRRRAGARRARGCGLAAG
ncbi:MAG: LLM class flavin-dependent oxidoreductase, partial [Deltaproteobacteria bacterium]|nr:LLM class flavin-dependent oxidoreductase [Deltaproteobacteria bacterium]